MPKHNPIRHDLITVGAVLALTTVEWWENRDHHDLWERVYSVTRGLIVGACLIAALCSLTGCRSDENPPADVPGIDQGHVPFSPEQALVGRLNNSLGATR